MNIKFFSTFRTPDGRTHWAVNSYNPLNGIVTFMKDLKFDDCAYIGQDRRQDYDDCYDSGRFFVNEFNDKFVVTDRICDKDIAVFLNLADANHFCDMKNGNEICNDFNAESF